MAKTLEDQIRGTISFWCWRLNDHRRSADLEQSCRFRVIRSENKLQEIWENPDPKYGGARGVSKFLSDLCTNAFLDEQRKLSADKRIPRSLIVSLSDPVPSPNPEDPDSGDTLGDTISNDQGGGYQAFILADLRDGLTSEEFSIVEDVVAGYSVRESAARYHYSKSTAARIQTKAIAKVKRQIGELLHRPRPSLITIPLLGRSSYRPDRIDKPNLEAWKWSASIVHPFFPCPHAEASGTNIYQDFRLEGATQGPGRYALCGDCWATYWFKLTQWLEREMYRLEWELAGEALGTPK